MKALGISWDLREDIFSFKLKLEAGALTKRVVFKKFSLWSTWICSTVYT